MHPVGHEQPSILFIRVEEVTLKLELISTSKLIPKYCYNIQNAIAIYIYILGTDPGGVRAPKDCVTKRDKRIKSIFNMKKIHTCICKAVYVPLREPFKKKDVYFCKAN